jgi:hypothetical protein
MGELLRLEAAQEVTFGLPRGEEPPELGCFRREDCALVGNHLLFRISMKNFFIIRKDLKGLSHEMDLAFNDMYGRF